MYIAYAAWASGANKNYVINSCQFQCAQKVNFFFIIIIKLLYQEFEEHT